MGRSKLSAPPWVNTALVSFNLSLSRQCFILFRVTLTHSFLSNYLAVCHFSTEASANALFRCPKSELSMLGDRFDAFNLYAKPFPWSKPISGPGRVQNASTPRHRRRIVDGGDFTISAKHMIRQELEGVECYDARGRRTMLIMSVASL